MASLGVLVTGTLHSMRTTLRNVFRTPNTIQYPRVKRPLPGQWRGGTFALTLDPKTDEENCIGCRLCEYICPSQIIAVALRKGEPRKNGLGATYAKSFTLDYQACMQCELCIQVCPTDAIVMTRYMQAPTTTREGLHLDMERMLGTGRTLLQQPALESAATAARLQEWTHASRGLQQATEKEDGA